MGTRLVEVEGFVHGDEGPIPCKMFVRFTSDELGETISISAEDMMMFVVPFEPVDFLIKRTRRDQKEKSKGDA